MYRFLLMAFLSLLFVKGGVSEMGSWKAPFNNAKDAEAHLERALEPYKNVTLPLSESLSRGLEYVHAGIHNSTIYVNSFEKPEIFFKAIDLLMEHDALTFNNINGILIKTFRTFRVNSGGLDGNKLVSHIGELFSKIATKFNAGKRDRRKLSTESSLFLQSLQDLFLGVVDVEKRNDLILKLIDQLNLKSQKLLDQGESPIAQLNFSEWLVGQLSLEDTSGLQKEISNLDEKNRVVSADRWISFMKGKFVNEDGLFRKIESAIDSFWHRE